MRIRWNTYKWSGWSSKRLANQREMHQEEEGSRKYQGLNLMETCWEAPRLEEGGTPRGVYMPDVMWLMRNFMKAKMWLGAANMLFEPWRGVFLDRCVSIFFFLGPYHTSAPFFVSRFQCVMPLSYLAVTCWCLCTKNYFLCFREITCIVDAQVNLDKSIFRGALVDTSWKGAWYVRACNDSVGKGYKGAIFGLWWDQGR